MMNLEHAEEFDERLDPYFKPVEVGDCVVEVPKLPYANENNSFVDYFSERSRDEYPDIIHQRIDKMENPNELVYSTLEDENFRRIMTSLLRDRDLETNIRFLTKLTGEKPEKSNLRKMDEMGMLEKGSHDYNDQFKLRKDSDAYWYLQIEEDCCELTDRKSLFDAWVNPENEAEFLASIGSPHTSMEEFARSW